MTECVFVLTLQKEEDQTLRWGVQGQDPRDQLTVEATLAHQVRKTKPSIGRPSKKIKVVESFQKLTLKKKLNTFRKTIKKELGLYPYQERNGRHSKVRKLG